MLPKYISDIVPSKRGGCRFWFEVEKPDLIWLCIVMNGEFRQIPLDQEQMLNLNIETDVVLSQIDDLEHYEDSTPPVIPQTPKTSDLDDIPF